MEQVIPGVRGAAPGAGNATLEWWQQEGKWFSYGGHAIFSRMAGQGDPVVLLHGFPTASWDWSRLWPMLQQHHSLFTLDMLGFGFSDKPALYDYSIEDQADMFEGWIAGLGLKTVSLFAHDYGGSVAQELLARDQEGLLPFSIPTVNSEAPGQPSRWPDQSRSHPSYLRTQLPASVWPGDPAVTERYG